MSTKPFALDHLTPTDRDETVALWTACGLTEPWNDPFGDFDKALETPTSTILGLKQDRALIGTVMAGYDGHRGWLYYVAVLPAQQGKDYGRQLVEAGEAWLLTQNAPKIQLMVRNTNSDVLGFYDALGYKDDDVVVLSKRFTK